MTKKGHKPTLSAVPETAEENFPNSLVDSIMISDPVAENAYGEPD